MPEQVLKRDWKTGIFYMEDIPDPSIDTSETGEEPESAEEDEEDDMRGKGMDNALTSMPGVKLPPVIKKEAQTKSKGPKPKGQGVKRHRSKKVGKAGLKV